ncbi:MAG: hypothetical protein ACKO04_16190 [Actinomycetes bacterium]
MAPVERVRADTPGDRAQRRLQLVIWALVALAALSLVSTLLFWRLTRPVAEDEAPAMRWATPDETAAVSDAGAVLVGAGAVASAGGAEGAPITEPHPVVTVPADPFAPPPTAPGPTLPPGPSVDAADAGAAAVVAGAAAPEVVVPSEVLDASADFEAEDASVPAGPTTPDPGPPSVPADGMWASAGWGQEPPAPAPSSEPPPSSGSPTLFDAEAAVDAGDGAAPQ